MTPAEAEHDREEGVITASEVADLAGVTQSAVSNWRKRFADFPGSAGTATSGGDLFRLSEVQAWLVAHPARRRKRDRDTGEQLLAVADRLRGRPLSSDLGVVVAVAAAFVKLSRHLGADVRRVQTNSGDFEDWVHMTIGRIVARQAAMAGLFEPLWEIPLEDLRLLLDPLVEFSADPQVIDAVDRVLDRTARYTDFRTTPVVADLVARLAPRYSSVLDPACGSGEFLLRAASHVRPTTLYGQELDESAWRIAKTRLILRDLDAEVVLGDSFGQDGFPDLRVDAVLCEPPAGHRFPNVKEPGGDQRWQLIGTIQAPLRRAAHFAWLAYAVGHLSTKGRAVVLLPTGSLVRSGLEAKFRSELLRHGAIESIITLGSGALQNSPAPAAVWILRPPRANPADVLLIAGEADEDADTDELHRRIVETVTSWRRSPTDFSPIAGFAVPVPVHELLEGDASLLPSRWLYDPALVDPDAVIAPVDEAQRAVTELLARDTLPIPDVELEPLLDRRPRLRVRDLVEQGLATLIRPGRLKLDEFGQEGVPVWLPADVRRRWEQAETTKFVDREKVDSEWITEPGDVVFTTVGGIRTRVDTEGGHLLGTSLQALRLNSDVLDPEVVAELLTSERNRALLRGTTIPRVDVLELELPLLELEEGRRLDAALQALERHEEMGHLLARRAGTLRTALIEAIATGAAVVRGVRGGGEDG